jgi:hypothetical protein
MVVTVTIFLPLTGASGDMGVVAPELAEAAAAEALRVTVIMNV